MHDLETLGERVLSILAGRLDELDEVLVCRVPGRVEPLVVLLSDWSTGALSDLVSVGISDVVAYSREEWVHRMTHDPLTVHPTEIWRYVLTAEAD